MAKLPDAERCRRIVALCSSLEWISEQNLRCWNVQEFTSHFPQKLQTLVMLLTERESSGHWRRICSRVTRRNGSRATIAELQELPKRVNTRFQLERACVDAYAWRSLAFRYRPRSAGPSVTRQLI
jgi:hypothetical protein